jgi:uncharacterized membrane protein YraQ (UPF0718 family)
MNKLFNLLGVVGLAVATLVLVLGSQYLLAGGVSLDIGDTFSTFITIFLGIFIEAAPFLLLGTLALGLVEVFLRKEWALRLLPRNPVMGAVAGGLLGYAFPVCECGVVPLTRRLFHKGMAPSMCSLPGCHRCAFTV